MPPRSPIPITKSSVAMPCWAWGIGLRRRKGKYIYLILKYLHYYVPKCTNWIDRAHRGAGEENGKNLSSQFFSTMTITKTPTRKERRLRRLPVYRHKGVPKGFSTTATPFPYGDSPLLPPPGLRPPLRVLRRTEHCAPLTRHGLAFSQPSKGLATPPARGTVLDSAVQESACYEIIAIPLSEILYCQYKMFQDCHFLVHPALHWLSLD